MVVGCGCAHLDHERPSRVRDRGGVRRGVRADGPLAQHRLAAGAALKSLAGGELKGMTKMLAAGRQTPRPPGRRGRPPRAPTPCSPSASTPRSSARPGPRSAPTGPRCGPGALIPRGPGRGHRGPVTVDGATRRARVSSDPGRGRPGAWTCCSSASASSTLRPGSGSGASTASTLPGQTLHSTYLDTRDYRLARAAITLRHRAVVDTGEASWQLELPSGTDRVELEAPGPPDRVPPELSRLLTARRARRRLVPVADPRDPPHPHARPARRSRGRRGRGRPGRRHRRARAGTAASPSWRSSCARPVRPRISSALPAGCGRWEPGGDGRPKLARALDLELDRPPVPARRRRDPLAPAQLAPQEQLAELVAATRGRGSTATRRAPRHARRRPPPARDPPHRPAAARRRATDELRRELKRVGLALGGRPRPRRVDRASSAARRSRCRRATSPGSSRLAASLADERREARQALLTVLEGPRYLWLLDRLDGLARRAGARRRRRRAAARRPGPTRAPPAGQGDPRSPDAGERRRASPRQDQDQARPLRGRARRAGRGNG